MIDRRLFLGVVLLGALGGCSRPEATGAAPAASGSAGTTGAQAPAPTSTNVTLKGSDTMVILGQRWAEDYMASHKGVVIQVTGGGSGTGIAALINGTTDVAQSSRSIKDEEQKQIEERFDEKAHETVAWPDQGVAYPSIENWPWRMSSNAIRNSTGDRKLRIPTHSVLNFSIGFNVASETSGALQRQNW